MLDLVNGVNIGDALDAFDSKNTSDELDCESAWTGFKISEQYIKAICDTGFNTVRLPVSWHNHLTDANYTISERWLDRVEEVVRLIIESGMYVILNIHHDNNINFLYPSSEKLKQSVSFVCSIWKQLAERFKHYDEHLIFNSMNEPRLVGHECEWNVNLDNPDVREAIDCINIINQEFVNTVRLCGGYNKTRYLLCPGYDASAEGLLNEFFEIPRDTKNRVLLSVHAYVPFHFALDENGVSEWSSANSEDIRNTIGFMDRLYDKYISKGIPVIIDEFGARNKNGNTASRIDFAACYTAAARERGMTCLWWDNGRFKENEELFGLFDRSKNEWVYPEIVRALIDGSKQK